MAEIMISQEELEEKSRELEINIHDVQRDYVFGWFLFILFSQSSLKEHLFLKGGNALRKGYFENTRYSSDLDLGMENDIPQSELQEEINKICRAISDETGISFLYDRNRITEKFSADSDLHKELKVYDARVYFQDLRGNARHITVKIAMDITRYDRVFLEIQNRPLIHPYSDFEKLQGNIRCQKLEEIVATKLKCLMQRDHAPDLYDYVYTIFFNNDIALDKFEIVKTFLKKTIFEPSPGVVKKILLDLPLEMFNATWSHIVCVKKSFFDLNSAVDKFKEGIRDIFQGFPETTYSDLRYFPSHLRHPILKAGREQTLLKLKYNGYERLVEPYALKYKQARDKSPKEYLFAYDLSGGSSRTISIKTFVAQNVQEIENTETKFTPRDNYEVELAKAGEHTEDRYFKGSGRVKGIRYSVPVGSSIYSISRSKLVGRKYTFRCSLCNKKILKRKFDSTIGPHKNKYGGACYGRHGLLVK